MEVRQYMSQVYRVITLLMLITACILAANHANLSNFFPIRYVSVYGANHMEHAAVEDVLRPYLSKGFFSIDVEFIRDRLGQLPWVSGSFVRRHWPDQVEIGFIEKKATARWNNSGLLSDGGEIFAPPQPSWPKDIPTFIGPDGSQLQMLENYKAIDRILSPLHAKISSLELTPFATWNLKLENGLFLQIGYRDSLTRLSHFVKVYPKIIGTREKDVEYVDLRYSNGVAVKWKEPTG